jgi:hypothetical protein
MARSPNETVPRQFRLTEETLARLDRISEHYHLRSRADAIRLAATLVTDQLPQAADLPRRKTRKKSQART